MAFTSTITNQTAAGGMAIVYGTFTNTAGSTGGQISTGLNNILMFSSSNNSQAATTNSISVSRGTVTLTTVADEDGYWKAEGY